MWLLSKDAPQWKWLRVFGVSSRGNSIGRAETFWPLNQTLILWAMIVEKWTIPMSSSTKRAAMLMMRKTILGKTGVPLKMSTFQHLDRVYWRSKASIFSGNSQTHKHFIACKRTTGLLQCYGQSQILGITRKVTTMWKSEPGQSKIKINI